MNNTSLEALQAASKVLYLGPTKETQSKRGASSNPVLLWEALQSSRGHCLMWATAFSKALASPDLDAYDVDDCFPPAPPASTMGLWEVKWRRMEIRNKTNS